MTERLDARGFIDSLWGARFDLDPRVFNFKRMDKTERIGPRTLDHHQVNYVVKGRIDGVAAETRFQCPQGSLLWLAPGTPHSMIYPRDMVFYYFRFLPIGVSGGVSIAEPWLLEKDARALFPLVQSIVLEFLTDAPFREEHIKSEDMCLHVFGVEEAELRRIMRHSV